MKTMSQEEHFIRKGKTVALADDHATLELRKIFTPAGERFEIEATDLGHSIRLDAMELETLSWQDHETYIGFLEDRGELPEGFSGMAGTALDADATVVQEWSVTNEFAEAHVRKLETGDGERLEIEAPKLGYRIRLAPLEVEGVTWQETETFTTFLETPFGPDAH